MATRPNVTIRVKVALAATPRALRGAGEHSHSLNAAPSTRGDDAAATVDSGRNAAAAAATVAGDDDDDATAAGIACGGRSLSLDSLLGGIPCTFFTTTCKWKAIVDAIDIFKHVNALLLNHQIGGCIFGTMQLHTEEEMQIVKWSHLGGPEHVQ